MSALNVVPRVGCLEARSDPRDLGALPNVWRPVIAFVGILFLLFLSSVSAETPARFETTPISPKVIIPNALGKHHFSRHSVLADEFIQITSDNFALIINGRMVDRTKVTLTGDDPPVPERNQAPVVFVRHEGKTLDLWLPVVQYHGRTEVQLLLDNRLSKPYEVIISRVTRFGVAVIAILVTFFVVGIPLWMIRGAKSSHSIDGKPCSLWTVLLLDKATDKYSLSKLQFLIWTAVTVFGYAFLTVARSLVQAKFEFADLPQNLAGLVAISAGTGVLAPAIASVKGSKGAGQIQPSVADLVTSGGIVVAERFQFMIWTLMGSVTFLFITVGVDPRSIHDLPAIPDGFLQLMGVSSVAYLGGKLARKPGPIIDEITATKTHPLTLTVTGRKLSRTASFQIDGTTVEAGAHQFTLAGVEDADEQSVSPDFFKKLIIEIKTPVEAWQSGTHAFAIINPDGQMAEWNYKV